MTDRPTDPLGFELALLDELEQYGIKTADLREWVNEACRKWRETDMELAAMKLVRSMSIGQPIWWEGHPGMVIATSKTRVTIEFFFPTKDGTGNIVKQKSPRSIRTVNTPQQIETWRERMRELRIDHAAALVWAAAENGVER